MIPALSLMVGAYIMTKMIVLLSRTKERSETGLVKALAVITFLIALFCIVDIFTKANKAEDIAKSLSPMSGSGRNEMPNR